MAVSRSPAKEKDTATGGKHQTEHESLESKRAKTEEDGTVQESRSGSEEKFEKKDEENEASPNASNENNNGNTEDAVQPAQKFGMQSNALEKGIVYFLIRGRVNTDEPERVDDIARSYMLLRPIPKDAKLGKGPMGDSGNTRVLALPRKTFPVHSNDKLIVFVDMSKASYQDLKDDFLVSSEYATKKVGTRHKPQATPITQASTRLPRPVGRAILHIYSGCFKNWTKFKKS